MWPQILPNDNMATPDYIVFELNIVGEHRWLEVGRADTSQSSLLASIPATGIDTQFQLRVKCASNSHGNGEYYTSTDVFTAYSSGKTICRLFYQVADLDVAGYIYIQRFKYVARYNIIP